MTTTAVNFYLEPWRRFRDLQGGTTPSAFWWPLLIHPAVFFILGGIFALILGLNTDPIGSEVLYAIAYIWLLLGLVPVLTLGLLCWLVQPSTHKTRE